MAPFLQQVASAFYERYGSSIHRLTFVFPNQRAGLFFRKYLSQLTEKPLFSPSILTINELFLRLSDKQPADRIRMLFLLYRIYIRHSRSDERFDDFVFWGDMLLNDFNDIDKYLVDAAHLFTNIKDIHQIDRDFSYLQPEQIEAIRAFWSSFQPKGLAENRQQFLDIWQHLHDIYRAFKQELASEGTGYEGMIFREVVERLKENDNKHIKDGGNEHLKEDGNEYFKESGNEHLKKSGEKTVKNQQSIAKQFEKIIFVGLNALSATEKSLLKFLQRQGIADFYWDAGAECLTDTNNKASFFIRENLILFPSEMQLTDEEVRNGLKEEKSSLQLPEELPQQHSENQPYWPEIELIGIPSRIGQAKQVYSILKETVAGKTDLDPEEALRTAIVL
ncbi:MAG: PD-(D/E)XK nuclease family protein, partial [Tannerella sp.]|nr:PD-(D/E)XK nuclease family protein [Tannerella sp.]